MGGHPAESLSELRDNTEWGYCDNCEGLSSRPNPPIRMGFSKKLRVLDGHGVSEVQSRPALVNSRSDPSSFERGGVLCRRMVPSKCRRAGTRRFEVEPGLKVTVLFSSRETDRPLTLGPASARFCEGLPHLAHGTVDPPAAPPSRAEGGLHHFPELVR